MNKKKDWPIEKKNWMRRKPTSRKVYLMKLDTFAMKWIKNTNSNTTPCIHSLLEQRSIAF